MQRCLPATPGPWPEAWAWGTRLSFSPAWPSLFPHFRLPVCGVSMSGPELSVLPVPTGLLTFFSPRATAQQVTRGLSNPFFPLSSFLLGPPGTTPRPWRDTKLDTATPPVLPSRPRSPDQMLRGHPGLPRPLTSEQPGMQCPGEKGQVAPAEAPIILSSPRTSKTDSYELVWRPRHEGGNRAPILYYVVKHRKVWCLALCPGRGLFPLAISP